MQPLRAWRPASRRWNGASGARRSDDAVGVARHVARWSRRRTEGLCATGPERGEECTSESCPYPGRGSNSTAHSRYISYYIAYLRSGAKDGLPTLAGLRAESAVQGIPRLVPAATSTSHVPAPSRVARRVARETATSSSSSPVLRVPRCKSRLRFVGPEQSCGPGQTAVKLGVRVERVHLAGMSSRRMIAMIAAHYMCVIRNFLASLSRVKKANVTSMCVMEFAEASTDRNRSCRSIIL